MKSQMPELHVARQSGVAHSPSVRHSTQVSPTQWLGSQAAFDPQWPSGEQVANVAHGGIGHSPSVVQSAHVPSKQRQGSPISQNPGNEPLMGRQTGVAAWHGIGMQSASSRHPVHRPSSVQMPAGHPTIVAQVLSPVQYAESQELAGGGQVVSATMCWQATHSPF
jgi:hypothetical protein